MADRIKTFRVPKPVAGKDTAGRTVTVPTGRYLELGRRADSVTLDVPDAGAITIPTDRKGKA